MLDHAVSQLHKGISLLPSSAPLLIVQLQLLLVSCRQLRAQIDSAAAANTAAEGIGLPGDRDDADAPGTSIRKRPRVGQQQQGKPSRLSAALLKLDHCSDPVHYASRTQCAG